MPCAFLPVFSLTSSLWALLLALLSRSAPSLGFSRPLASLSSDHCGVGALAIIGIYTWSAVLLHLLDIGLAA